jgi:hypothetical protein
MDVFSAIPMLNDTTAAAMPRQRQQLADFDEKGCC